MTDPPAPRTPAEGLALDCESYVSPHPSPSADSETAIPPDAPSPSSPPLTRETIARTLHGAPASARAHSTRGDAARAAAPPPATPVALFPAEARPPAAATTGRRRRRSASAHPRGGAVHSHCANKQERQAALQSSGFRGWKTVIAEDGDMALQSLVQSQRTIVALQRTLADGQRRHGSRVEALTREISALERARADDARRHGDLEEAAEGLRREVDALTGAARQDRERSDAQRDALERARRTAKEADLRHGKALHDAQQVFSARQKKARSLLGDKHQAVAALTQEARASEERTHALLAAGRTKDAKISALEGQVRWLDGSREAYRELQDAQYLLKKKCDLQVAELLALTAQLRAAKDAAEEAARVHAELVAKHQRSSDELRSLKEAARKLEMEVDRSPHELKEKNISLEHSVKVLQTEATERQELHAKESAAKETKIAELQSSNEGLTALIDEERTASDRLHSEVKRLVPHASAAERHQQNAAAYKAKWRSKVEELALQTKANEHLRGQCDEAHENSLVLQEHITFLEEKVRQIEARDDEEAIECVELLSSDDDSDEEEAGAGDTAAARNGTPAGTAGAVDAHGAAPARGAAPRDGARRRRGKSPAPVPCAPGRREVCGPQEGPGDAAKTARARTRGGRKSTGTQGTGLRARSPKIEGPSRGVKSASVRACEIGEVGYLFKRYFPEYTKSYEGEVIAILGNSMRRCRYTDGSIEDYRLADVRDRCQPRL